MVKDCVTRDGFRFLPSLNPDGFEEGVSLEG